MLLTEITTLANITSMPVTNLLEYSCKYMGRFEARKNNGVGYTPSGVWLFLCPKSLLSTLKNPPLWWARLLEQFRYTALQTNMNAHRPKIEAFRGGLSLNNGVSPMNTHTQKLTLSVSTTKQQSLQKQLEIIGYALDIFCTEPNENNRLSLKLDVLELARMLDDLLNDLPRKTSSFNVLVSGMGT